MTHEPEEIEVKRFPLPTPPMESAAKEGRFTVYRWRDPITGQRYRLAHPDVEVTDQHGRKWYG